MTLLSKCPRLVGVRWFDNLTPRVQPECTRDGAGRGQSRSGTCRLSPPPTVCTPDWLAPHGRALLNPDAAELYVPSHLFTLLRFQLLPPSRCSLTNWTQLARRGLLPSWTTSKTETAIRLCCNCSYLSGIFSKKKCCSKKYLISSYLTAQNREHNNETLSISINVIRLGFIENIHSAIPPVIPQKEDEHKRNRPFRSVVVCCFRLYKALPTQN